MASISNPNHVLYACIARGNTILAEFNRDQPDLPQLAALCIQLTPPNHSMFSQTCRRRTYSFLIDHPLIYFGIFDAALDKSEGLSLLGKLKAAFPVKSSTNLSPSPSLQSKFDAILRDLVPPGSDSELGSSPGVDLKKPPGSETRNFTAQVVGSPGKGLKKKKRFNGEVANGGGSDVVENKVDVSDEMNGLVHKDHSHSVSERQKAKQVWKKQVWVVLSLDLFVCAVLFGVWLWVCRGFQCIDG